MQKTGVLKDARGLKRNGNAIETRIDCCPHRNTVSLIGRVQFA